MRTLTSPLIDERCNEAGPPRLVRGPESAAILAVKVLVEEDVVFPVWVCLKLRAGAKHGTFSVSIPGKDTDESVRDRAGELCKGRLSAVGLSNGIARRVRLTQFLQRLYDQK